MQFPTFWVVFIALVAILFFLATIVPQLDIFPEEWSIGLRDPFNTFKRWVVVNRRTHWMFLFFFEPLSAVLDFLIRALENLLIWLPWPIVILSFFFAANRISGFRLGLLVSACLLFMGLFGLWEERACKRWP